MTKQATATKSKKSSLFRSHVRPDLQPTMARIGRVKDDQFVQESYEVQVNTPVQYIPNYYEARVVKTYDANGAYRGHFKFLSELTKSELEKNPEIVQIPIRYVKGTSSLDEKWQNDNGFRPKTDEEKIGWSLQSGRVTEWDMSKIDEHFVRFFVNHEGNGANPNRDVQNSVLFTVVDDAPTKNKLLEDVLAEKEYMDFKAYLLNEESEDKLKAIARMFKLEGASKYEADTLKVEIIKRLTMQSYEKYVDAVQDFNDFIEMSVSNNKWEVRGDNIVNEGDHVMTTDQFNESAAKDGNHFNTLSGQYQTFDKIYSKLYLPTKKIK